MADLRYFERLGPLTVNQIAALSGAAILDSGQGDVTVSGVAALSDLTSGVLGYAEGKALSAVAAAEQVSGVLIVPEGQTEVSGSQSLVLLTHAAPRAAFARAASALFRLRRSGETGIAPSAQLAATVHLAAGASVGDGAVIEADVEIGPGASVGPGCHIGEGTRIGANATVICAEIGRNCNILSGAVIGDSGFGVAVSADGVVDVPHLGGVSIGDHVTVGANSTIDRGVFGNTRLGDGCKIDNLCHIAHNVSVGRNVLMPAFAGVSGSTVIGDNVMFGGRVGVSDHVTIGDNARIGANSAVMGDVPAGETYAGAPAQPIRRHMREIAELRRLVRAKEKKRGG